MPNVYFLQGDPVTDEQMAQKTSIQGALYLSNDVSGNSNSNRLYIGRTNSIGGIKSIVTPTPYSLTLQRDGNTLGTFDGSADTTINFKVVPLIDSTDNAIVRFDGTGGYIQNSKVKINDNGQIILPNTKNAKLLITENSAIVEHDNQDTLITDGGKWNVSFIACCFESGTQVQYTLDGKTKNIEDFKKGDKIISYNINKKEFYEAICNGLIVNKNTIHIAKVILEDETYVVMNEYHPILTKDGFHSITCYKGYDPLYIGDMVVTTQGLKEIINIERTWLKEPLITYNLDVIDINENNDIDINDTYIANGMVVHNAACPV